MEESAEIPDSPVKFDRYVERAVFQCQPVRPTLPSALTIEDFVQTAVTHPYGRRFMRALSGEWRACTRVSHYLFDATVVLIDKELLTLDLWCGHVTKGARTSRIWQGYSATCGRISRLQGWCRRRVLRQPAPTIWLMCTRTKETTCDERSKSSMHPGKLPFGR